MEELPVVDFMDEDRARHQKALKRKRDQKRTTKKEPKNLKKPKINFANRENESEGISLSRVLSWLQGPSAGFGTAFATILRNEAPEVQEN